MFKSKAMSTIWIILISIGGTLLILGIIVLVWYCVSTMRKISETSGSQTTPTALIQDQGSEATVKTPSEEPAQVAENFLNSIFDSLGAGLNLSKANNYLTSDLQAKVNGSKESYWDIHNVYIAAGPCRVGVEQLDKSASAATVRIDAEWGIPDSCNITPMRPEFHYKMTNVDGQWKISEIVPLNPDTEGQENVPRGF